MPEPQPPTPKPAPPAAQPAAPLVQDKADAVLSGPLTQPPAPPAPFDPNTLREFGDYRKTRQAIYDNVFAAVKGLEPVSNKTHTLRLSSPEWADPDRFTRKQRKEALLTGGTLSRRMKATWELVDNATGSVVDKRHQVIARVPYLTSMGTFVHNGNDYTLSHQQRLRSGVFARRKDNGEIEAHVNIMPGKGVSHRYYLDPAKGTFHMKVGQAKLPLMGVLKALGATDAQIKEAWGDELYATNYAKANDASAVKKLKARLLKPDKPDARDGDGDGKVNDGDDDERSSNAKLADAFAKMELDPEVTKRTLGKPYTNLSPEVMLAATKKLLGISRGEQDVDDRDHLAYQTFLGPEDLFSERVRRDHGRLRSQLLMKASFKGSLKDMPSGSLSPQLEQALLGSGLGQAIEEINPAEVFDKQSRISRLGEGGIPSVEAVPDEARGVQPSHMGYMDPLRTPESFRVGVDVQMSRGARKGPDGRIYTQFRDLKTGQPVWKSPQDVADMAVAFPGALRLKNEATLPAGFRYSALAAMRRLRDGGATPQDRTTVEAYKKAAVGLAKRVPVMKGGKITYAPRDEVDLELPTFEDSFSPLGNLVPLKSMVKGQRVAMASRMLTQALPLQGGESPLVQGAVPGSGGAKSFEEEYGSHMGAVRADKGGRVVSIADGTMRVQHDDGTTDDIELYEHFPFNRKTYIHQTPVVKPGDNFKPGQLLVRSNYTDGGGATALGINARVAYMPWKGYNFEDAVVISEAMAKRMSSEHMYQHDVEVDDRTKMGKKAYVSLFPQKFEKKVLDTLDDDGVIKVGQEVKYGQPIILAAKERDRAQNKVHKQRQAGFNDSTVLWKHHDNGVVTDVVRGKKGPVVLVKSVAGMQVGDKMSGRYGDKGVVAAIVPDHKMPHGPDGKPFEVLLNPLGVISRTNPAQKVEAMLGKIARLTGKPVKIADFEDIDDLTEYAEQELKKHGLKDLDDLTDPDSGRKIRGVATGERFFMKLHHTAESKGQGRGSGGYGMDETPSKGGETGCFVGPTRVRTRHPGTLKTLFTPINALVELRAKMEVFAGSKPHSHRKHWAYGWEPITDYFKYAVPAEDVIEVEFDNGATIGVTRNHKFYLRDGTEILAGEVTEGTDLQGVDDEPRTDRRTRLPAPQAGVGG